MSRLWTPDIAGRAAPPGAANDVADRYDQGYADARATLEAEVAAERAMLLQMIEAAVMLTPADPEPLAQLLGEAVLRLVTDIVGTAPVDAALLRQRALALTEVIQGEDGPATLHVHPDGVALLTGLSDRTVVRVDPALPPGLLRLTRGDALIEDGVPCALARLRAALTDLGCAA